MSTITINSKPTNAEIAPATQESEGVQAQTPPGAETIPTLKEVEDAQDNAPLDTENIPKNQENGDVQGQTSLETKEDTQAPTSTPPQEETHEPVATKQNATSQEHSPSPKRKRKTKEERLQIALAKQAALDTKIAGLKKELDENAQKTRNRGLVLVGIVVEQCFKKDVFSEENKKWWLRQAKRLPDKDREAYVEFLKTL